MIRDLDAYRRSNDAEHRKMLAQRTIEESIAIGEALLTSELMQDAVFSDDDKPMALAIALGMPRSRLNQ